MRDRTKLLLIGVAATAAAALPAIAQASADDDRAEVPATGTDLERGSEAAIAHLGGGRVTGSEVGDEESYYEIEVTLEDGRQVDVQLDESFDVVGSENDGAETDD
ncbi:MAG: PepSY domain-containing protein [Actinobacteria bacterium]|nr:PepSY domain-containing protein [Actinomycetota bacterium]MCI0543632.1 PepSY domain-containing protein [Actinomycetota bacterium]